MKGASTRHAQNTHNATLQIAQRNTHTKLHTIHMQMHAAQRTNKHKAKIIRNTRPLHNNADRSNDTHTQHTMPRKQQAQNRTRQNNAIETTKRTAQHTTTTTTRHRRNETHMPRRQGHGRNANGPRQHRKEQTGKCNAQILQKLGKNHNTETTTHAKKQHQRSTKYRRQKQTYNKDRNTHKRAQVAAAERPSDKRRFATQPYRNTQSQTQRNTNKH